MSTDKEHASNISVSKQVNLDEIKNDRVEKRSLNSVDYNTTIINRAAPNESKIQSSKLNIINTGFDIDSLTKRSFNADLNIQPSANEVNNIIGDQVNEEEGIEVVDEGTYDMVKSRDLKQDTI